MPWPTEVAAVAEGERLTGADGDRTGSIPSIERLQEGRRSSRSVGGARGGLERRGKMATAG
jgi:hypothetical protein